MTHTTIDPAALAHLQTWHGKSETLSDSFTAMPLAALSALDAPQKIRSPGARCPRLQRPRH